MREERWEEGERERGEEDEGDGEGGRKMSRIFPSKAF